jgi:2-polyprenyl-3-methyl-5-hydroxy-6-metoxy-1,4-benzoquinol methylase
MTASHSSATTAPCPICGNVATYEFSGRDLMYSLRVRYDYFLCPACACVFQHPMPDMATIASFYPPDYMVFDQEKRTRRISPMRLALLRRKRGYAHLDVPLPYRLVAALIAPFQQSGAPDWNGGGRMLDVGCGNGRYLTTMRTLGWDVQGVEFSASGVEACLMSGLRVHHGDLASAGFADGSFDLVTARHVIEHIPDPHTFMAELARILRPGGRLVIETPSSAALGRQWFNTYWYANDVPRHLLLFSPANLERLGRDHGLSKSGLVMDTSPKIFLNSLDYIIGNRGKPSRHVFWRRLLARIYVALARKNQRGDTMQMTFVKQ